jgi:PIN domain nuclease of toxin-antitoxin system
MTKLYVIDTCCIIAYFKGVFHEDKEISSKTRELIKNALNQQDGDIKISIPSIVFIEIFEKWLIHEEFSRKFYYEVYIPLKESPNIEIRPLDQEILEMLIKIDGILINHDMHDKIILASAVALDCQLITFDKKIENYVEQTLSLIHI